MKGQIHLPKEVGYIINMLCENGFEAFVVGGAVRDYLLGITPHDFDVATSALPSDVSQIFERTIATGLKHGTVTVIIDKLKVEVTTYRTEGTYSDNRRPDSVNFVNNIKEDLARRDFTINAMAYNEKEGLVDPFGGFFDIENKIVKAVGEPLDRFGEDSLRILRCIRFSSSYGFDIEKRTLEACKILSDTVNNVSCERILSEFNRIFLSANEKYYKVLDYTNVFANVLPEALPISDGKIQRAVSCISLEGKWAWLCEDNVKHALFRLKSSNDLKNKAAELSEYINKNIENIKGIASKLKNISPEELCNFKSDFKTLEIYYRALQRKEPIYISDLKVDGQKLIKWGINGKDIGKALNKLLEAVIETPDKNSEDELFNLLVTLGYIKDKRIQ